MSTITDQTAPLIEGLLKSDPDQLYAELGLRAKAITQDVAVAGSLDAHISDETAQAMGLREDLQEFGQRVYNRWSVEAYKLMCGADADDAADRKKLVAALGLGDVAVGSALSGALIGLGLAPLLAPVVAALVVTRFFRPGLQEFCAVWKNHLPQTAS